MVFFESENDTSIDLGESQADLCSTVDFNKKVLISCKSGEFKTVLLAGTNRYS